jgi:hypothetical protein
LELKAEESASTLVGQNSTQNPQALQRSTTMETRPFAMDTPGSSGRSFPETWDDYALPALPLGVTAVTDVSEGAHTRFFW